MAINVGVKQIHQKYVIATYAGYSSNTQKYDHTSNYRYINCPVTRLTTCFGRGSTPSERAGSQPGSPPGPIAIPGCSGGICGQGAFCPASTVVLTEHEIWCVPDRLLSMFLTRRVILAVDHKDSIGP